jgi:alkylation response protein AidB-like acyl-CoA dehydrogenase
MVGRAQKILEMVVEYSKVRVQFGRPIGAFQAVQHRCADLKVAVDGAQMVTHRAAWKVTQGLPCSEDVAMAKAAAGALSRMAVTAGHTIFAGIAFTMDHDMQMYTQRSKVAEANLGDTDFHLDRLGDQMGL